MLQEKNLAKNILAKKEIRIAAAILSIIWMTVIFLFSAQDSLDSTEMSMTTSYHMVEAADKLFNLGMASTKMLELAEEIEGTIRKIAHMTEFAILFFFVGIVCKSFVLDTSKKELIKRILFALGFTTIYAASDEIHQLFVPGRHGCVKDVFIDVAGAIAVVLIVLVRLRIKKELE